LYEKTLFSGVQGEPCTKKRRDVIRIEYSFFPDFTDSTQTIVLDTINRCTQSNPLYSIRQIRQSAVLNPSNPSIRCISHNKNTKKAKKKSILGGGIPPRPPSEKQKKTKKTKT